MLGAATFVNVEFFPERPGFLDISPHPLTLLVVLMAGHYGLMPGLFTAAASTGVLALVTYRYSMVTDLTSLFRGDGGVPVASLALISVFVGELREMTLRRYRRVVEEHDLMASRLDELAEAYTALQDEKYLLEKAVLSDRAPIEFVSQLVESLDTLEEPRLWETLARLIEDIGHTTSVAIYLLDAKESSRLIVSRGGKFEPELDPEEPLTRSAIARRQTTTVAELADASLERMAGSRLHIAIPVLRPAPGPPAALVLLQDVPLPTFSRMRLKALELAGRLAGRMLARMELYRLTLDRNVLDVRIPACTPFYLRKRGQEEVERAVSRRLPLSAVRLEIQDFGGLEPATETMLLETLAEVLRHQMGPGQLLARSADPGGFVILLPLDALETARELARRIAEEVADFELRPYGDDRLLRLTTRAVALVPPASSWTEAETRLSNEVPE